jgi:hypothetical protein
MIRSREIVRRWEMRVPRCSCTQGTLAMPGVIKWLVGDASHALDDEELIDSS